MPTKIASLHFFISTLHENTLYPTATFFGNTSSWRLFHFLSLSACSKSKHHLILRFIKSSKVEYTNLMMQSTGQLAVIATPIGNLGDLSPRAARMLQNADILACEDTRVTRKLLSLTGLRTSAKFIPYHDHNGKLMRPKLLAAMSAGNLVALVSDAGTPLVSDPGYKLVAACHDAGIDVITIPGPSAVLAALSAAGLPSNRFLFAGFVPNSQKAASTAFREFTALPITTIWFESPRRLGATLQLMYEEFGDRLAVVARELTKLHENFHRDSLELLKNFYAKSVAPKGEIVILISGANERNNEFDEIKLISMLREEMQATSLRDAVQTVTQVSGQPRKKIYSLAIDLNSEGKKKN
jgi:16S rRNA (cytidine1402-2'-O)-methyltransferase